jgi:lipopolysaccharide export system ATP-binding protein
VTLLAKELVKVYGSRPVVNGVNVDVEPGEVVGLLGPNGAGKTTSFYMVVGMVPPTRGQVMLDGQAIERLPIHQRAKLGLGYLPQETSVFRKLTVEENLKLVLEFQPITPTEQSRRMNMLLDEFGLNKVRKSVAIQLSGGERRRVEIARAIATNPKYLLLDEPFTGIDPIAIQDIQRLIGNLKDRGLGILLTDHNPKATLSIVDRANIIVDGQVIFSGASQEVAQNPMVQKYYLGSDFSL